MRASIPTLASLLVSTTALVVLLGNARPPMLPKVYESHEANRKLAERREIDNLYAKADWPKAKSAYIEFVTANKNNPSKEVQDEVASARLHIGYIAAKQKNFAEAREIFAEADKEYRGTESKGGDYGALDDQAAYQAIVCLEASGDKIGAEREYIAFLKERKLSPLVHACWRRLKRLNGGKPKPLHDALFQAAVSATQNNRRLEGAMCGPKSIAEILKRFKDRDVDYHEIAKACTASEDGATLEGMIRGLNAYGFTAKAKELNANDFRQIPVPAIWLNQDHFVAIIDRMGNDFRIFDSLDNSRNLHRLPVLEDAKFRATVLILSSKGN